MKRWARYALLTAVVSCVSLGHGQSTEFDIQAYKQFLSTHSSLQPADLQAMYPAGRFHATSSPPLYEPAYLDSISSQYSLTSYELDLIASHGFAVSSRLARNTFIQAFAEIYHNDLPVFVSTDAILQAVHNSYDNILKFVEKSRLVPQLTDLLATLRAEMPALNQRYGTDPRMGVMLRDVDVYLTVPSLLLGAQVTPYYPENAPWVSTLLHYIQAQENLKIPLFAETRRWVDFSQFTVRGHYTDDSTLAKYFRAMIWLGRTEIYLMAPLNTVDNWPEADIQRQMIDAALIIEAVRHAQAKPAIQTIDAMLRFLVGESDNVMVDSLDALLQEAGILSADELLDTTRARSLQELLLQKPYADQRILSQVLVTDPMNPEQVRPASAFMLLGQRFVIDSYVFGNVVYDKIIWDGGKVRRMLPSPLDALFALGNNAAGQILEPELETFHYAPNLAGLRYLIDSYGGDFWSMSMFNSWLSMIRTLNPPTDRAGLPAFMQTAAWWQEKMNTQLGSWAQLRHDNLLYAKQSYTPGIICSFPHSYVEPIPEFYDAVMSYAEKGRAHFASLGLTAIEEYFVKLEHTADTLGSIARKELLGMAPSAEEDSFLRRMLVPSAMCGSPYTGWYAALFYGLDFVPGDNDDETDFVVADVHTSPTDEFGTMVGWVLHVGTGPVDMAIITAELPGGGACAFLGPVMNFYEHLSTDFKRLTDEEWETVYNVAPTLRPSLVNLYLADEKGWSRGPGPSLVTDVDGRPPGTLPASPTLLPNYPNPFNTSTVIPFRLPSTPGTHNVVLEVIDIHGRVIARLVNEVLPAGAYTVFWKGTSAGGSQVSTGVYFYRLTVGHTQTTRKLLLIR